MSDQDQKPDPIDEAYARAEAALTDEAARAARRARVLAAVAQDAPAPATANAPIVSRRRAGWGWGGLATAASVAGLGFLFTLHTSYRLPNGKPGSSEGATASQPPVAPGTPTTSLGVTPSPAPENPRSATRPAEASLGSSLDFPLNPMATPAAPVPAPPVVAPSQPQNDADLSVQSNRATLTLLDGQRLAGASPNAPASQAPLVRAAGDGRDGAAPTVSASSSDLKSGVNLAAAGTNIPGIKTVGSPVQRVTREDLLKSGATDIRSALQTLPLIQTAGVVGDTGGVGGLQPREVAALPPPPAALQARPAPPVQNASVALAAPPPPSPAGPGGQGSRATLGLLDGQRLAQSGLNTTSTVINPVPMSAFGSVEVLPGQPISAVDIAGQLRAAATAGRIAEVETLLSKGATIDAQDADGDTALMLSIKSSHPDIVELLRKRGASLTLTNKAGQRAADLARDANNAAINRALGLAP